MGLRLPWLSFLSALSLATLNADTSLARVPCSVPSSALGWSFLNLLSNSHSSRNDGQQEVQGRSSVSGSVDLQAGSSRSFEPANQEDQADRGRSGTSQHISYCSLKRPTDLDSLVVVQTKQTTRYQETPSVATSTAAPLTAPSEATEGLSFGDLLGETPSTLAPIPSTSSSSSRPTPLSLSRLLTQALHSSDTPLLNSCLSHSDPILVGQTVRRLQPELTVPLIERLAERMALGGKGRQGGASAQRVRGVCIWLKVTLREKLSYLSTIPNLLARLEPLHRLINERLALTGPLMALAGRLDLALAQMELREAGKEEESAREGSRYVEGESSEEDDSEDEEEVALEEGDIEDVGLGGDSDEDDEDASDVDDE